MIEVNEGKLYLVFCRNSWNIEKYDECNAFVNHLKKTINLKGVDFIGIHNNSSVYMMEIKDYSGHEQQKLREWGGNINNLTSDLAQKIKDSFIGIYSAKRLSLTDQNFWTELVDKFNGNDDYKVIFWIDGNLVRYNSNFSRTQLNLNLKQRLKCLNVKVLVTNSENANVINMAHEYQE
nr:hypothetical protein [uncultured Carboxylicivirga sp.]